MGPVTGTNSSLSWHSYTTLAPSSLCILSSEVDLPGEPKPASNSQSSCLSLQRTRLWMCSRWNQFPPDSRAPLSFCEGSFSSAVCHTDRGSQQKQLVSFYYFKKNLTGLGNTSQHLVGRSRWISWVWGQRNHASKNKRKRKKKKDLRMWFSGRALASPWP